jgi:hypothetical protein
MSRSTSLRLPGAGIYHGHAGWSQQIENFGEAIGELNYRVTELVDCRDDVLAVIEATGTGTRSGVTGTVT